jgi:hypothetical protein
LLRSFDQSQKLRICLSRREGLFSAIAASMPD